MERETFCFLLLLSFADGALYFSSSGTYTRIWRDTRNPQCNLGAVWRVEPPSDHYSLGDIFTTNFGPPPSPSPPYPPDEPFYAATVLRVLPGPCVVASQCFDSRRFSSTVEPLDRAVGFQTLWDSRLRGCSNYRKDVDEVIFYRSHASTAATHPPSPRMLCNPNYVPLGDVAALVGTTPPDIYACVHTSYVRNATFSTRLWTTNLRANDRFPTIFLNFRDASAWGTDCATLYTPGLFSISPSPSFPPPSSLARCFTPPGGETRAPPPLML
jgi:hypothetical protein